MIHFVLLISRQAKTRLAKWYSVYSSREKARILRESSSAVLSRPSKLCNFLEWKGHKIVYRRYASLYFVFGVDKDDNELLMLEKIHLFVELLDTYFHNVCELDLIFNFHKVRCVHVVLLLSG